MEFCNNFRWRDPFISIRNRLNWFFLQILVPRVCIWSIFNALSFWYFLKNIINFHYHHVCNDHGSNQNHGNGNPCGPCLNGYEGNNCESCVPGYLPVSGIFREVNLTTGEGVVCKGKCCKLLLTVNIKLVDWKIHFSLCQIALNAITLAH